MINHLFASPENSQLKTGAVFTVDHIINLDTAPTTGRSVGSENWGACGEEGSTQRADWVPPPSRQGAACVSGEIMLIWERGFLAIFGRRQLLSNCINAQWVRNPSYDVDDRLNPKRKGKED